MKKINFKNFSFKGLAFGIAGGLLATALIRLIAILPWVIFYHIQAIRNTADGVLVGPDSGISSYRTAREVLFFPDWLSGIIFLFVYGFIARKYSKNNSAITALIPGLLLGVIAFFDSVFTSVPIALSEFAIFVVPTYLGSLVYELRERSRNSNSGKEVEFGDELEIQK